MGTFCNSVYSISLKDSLRTTMDSANSSGYLSRPAKFDRSHFEQEATLECFSSCIRQYTLRATSRFTKA